MTPWSYKEQALLVGYAVLGESFSFIAAQVGRTEAQVSCQWSLLLQTIEDMQQPESTQLPVQPMKLNLYQPRKYRVLANKSREPRHGPIDVTASLMGDPSAAAVERAISSPNSIGPTGSKQNGTDPMHNTETKVLPCSDAIETINGANYLRDAKGSLVPVENVKPQHLLEDQTVRTIIGYAEKLSGQISRFRNHTFADLLSLTALLAEQYGSQKGGRKGNTTFQTVDGCQKVQVQVSDFIDFGPEILTAKALIDECLNEWAADSRPELRAIVTRAFNTDKEGQINKSEILMLLRLEIEDQRWIKAMEAIRDAMRVTGSKSYVRFYTRPSPDAPWQTITIDLAKAA